MNENYTYNPLANDLMSDFDRAYAEFRNTLAQQFDEYEDQLYRMDGEKQRLQKQIDSNVQANLIMEAMLPTLSELYNQVMEIEDVGILQDIVNDRFRVLAQKLGKLGIEWQMHKRGDAFDPEMPLDDSGSIVETNDPALNGKVARCNQIGCIIKGDERSRIYESIDIYKYVEPVQKEEPEKDHEENIPVSDVSEAKPSTDENKPAMPTENDRPASEETALTYKQEG
ncbi:MAG: hypothetical protein IJ489_00445 [Clostridia bacterium]|nr:hypothetical protein [Clostridia bacterium]